MAVYDAECAKHGALDNSRHGGFKVPDDTVVSVLKAASPSCQDIRKEEGGTVVHGGTMSTW